MGTAFRHMSKSRFDVVEEKRKNGFSEMNSQNNAVEEFDDIGLSPHFFWINAKAGK